MEKWVKDAKKQAEIEAKCVVDNLRETARDYDLVEEWFIEEVIKNMKMISLEQR